MKVLSLTLQFYRDIIIIFLTSDSDFMIQWRLLSPDSHGALIFARVTRLQRKHWLKYSKYLIDFIYLGDPDV